MKPQFKVVIAGGRDYNLSATDYEILNRLDKEYLFTHVICGGASGADSQGKRWANSKYITVEMFPAEWRRLGRKAGPMRNRLMAEAADAVILFPGHGGTDSMREEAIRAGCKILYDAKDVT